MNASGGTGDFSRQLAEIVLAYDPDLTEGTTKSMKMFWLMKSWVRVSSVSVNIL